MDADGESYKRVAEMFAKGIADLIKVAAEPDWIPVSERLPEEYERVIGWRAGVRPGEVWRTTGGDWRCGDCESAGGVTHWMPLPPDPG